MDNKQKINTEHLGVIEQMASAAKGITSSPEIDRIWVTFNHTARNRPPMPQIIEALDEIENTPETLIEKPEVLVYMRELFDLEHRAMQRAWKKGDEAARQRMDELSALRDFSASDILNPSHKKRSLKSYYNAAKAMRSVKDVRAVFANDNVTNRSDLPKDWKKLLDGVERDTGTGSVNPISMLGGILKHAAVDLYEFFEDNPKKATAVAAILAASYAFYYSEIGYTPTKTDVLVTGITEFDFQIDDDGGYEMSDFTFDKEAIDPDMQGGCHGHMKSIVDGVEKFTGINIEGAVVACEAFDKAPYEAQQAMITVSNTLRSPANMTFRDPYRDYDVVPDEKWMQGVKDWSEKTGDAVNTYNLWENRILHNFLLIFAMLKVLRAGRMSRDDWAEFKDDVIDGWQAGRKTDALMYAGGVGGMIASELAGVPMVWGMFGGAYAGYMGRKMKAHATKNKDHVMKATQGDVNYDALAQEIDKIDFDVIDNGGVPYFKMATLSYLGLLAATSPAAAMEFAGVLQTMSPGDLKDMLEQVSYLNGSLAASGAVAANFVAYNIPEEAVSHRLFPAVGASMAAGALGAWGACKAGVKLTKFAAANPKQSAAAFMLASSPLLGNAQEAIDNPHRDIVIPVREERYDQGATKPKIDYL